MNASKEASAQLLNHFLTMQMLFQGQDLEKPLQEVVLQEQQVLKEQIEEFQKRLFNKQQNEKELNEETFNKISEKDIFAAAQFQHDNITRTLEALKPVADKMENSLIGATQELAEKNALNNSLNQDLRNLTRELKNHKYSFQGVLNQMGQKVPSYVSHSMQGTLHDYQSAELSQSQSHSSICPFKT